MFLVEDEMQNRQVAYHVSVQWLKKRVSALKPETQLPQRIKAPE